LVPSLAVGVGVGLAGNIEGAEGERMGVCVAGPVVNEGDGVGVIPRVVLV
jgi:hypothetical protein